MNASGAPTPSLPGERALPWLSSTAMLLGAALLVGLFLLVDIPPLVDVVGHIGAAAIENADPGSPLHTYYEWHWQLIPNLGGTLLMKVLAQPFGVLAAGWWASLIATACLALGAMATIRALNPRGAFGFGWAIIFVFGFPWVMGFLNFFLATGLALLTFAATLRLRANPLLRGGILLAAQPILFMSHAIGGLMLPVLVAAESLGSALDDVKRGQLQLAGMPLRVARECWPLVLSLLFIVVWKVLTPSSEGAGMSWDWLAKLDFLMEALRDQSFVLDIATVVASYLIVLFGWLLGGRWSWRQGTPALAVFLLYALAPADINGVAFIDSRLLPIAMLLVLGLQDWSNAPARNARLIALSGTAVLLVRFAAIAASFAAYDADYRGQLRALDHVASGSRVLVYRHQSCSNVEWRMSRLEGLPALASLRKQAWINGQWTIPGVHMLQTKFNPVQAGEKAISPMAWDRRCPDSDGRSLDQVLREAPLSQVDYLWLLDTGFPATPPQTARLLWQWNGSALYRVGQ